MEKTKNCWVIPTDKPSRIHLDKRSVTYQDATNTFLFMKLAELTLKLKKYE